MKHLSFPLLSNSALLQVWTAALSLVFVGGEFDFVMLC